MSAHLNFIAGEWIGGGSLAPSINPSNTADVINGAFYSTGQRCTASARLVVTDGIHDRFVAAMIERMQKLVVGDALDAATQIGPVVDQAPLDQGRVLQMTT